MTILALDINPAGECWCKALRDTDSVLPAEQESKMNDKSGKRSWPRRKSTSSESSSIISHALSERCSSGILGMAYVAHVALADYRDRVTFTNFGDRAKQLQSEGDCPRNKTFACEAYEHLYTVRPRRSTDKFARECHVTFPTVFTVSICAVRYSLSPLLYTLDSMYRSKDCISNLHIFCPILYPGPSP